LQATRAELCYIFYLFSLSGPVTRRDSHGLGTISLVFDFMEADLDQLINAKGDGAEGALGHVPLPPDEVKAFVQVVPH
jgi:hypothetical protein